MEGFSELPQGCVSEILSLTSPRDACRSSAISSGFKSAADSDAVWERFLPSDYRQLISRSVSPVVVSTTKQLYFGLCDSPVLLDGGKLGFSLDKESGKKCYTLPARELNIAWKDTPSYWTWISLPESRFSEVAQLVGVCWLDIWGRMNTSMLSPNTHYAAYLIFKIKDQKHRHSGLESIRVEAFVRFVCEGHGDDGNADEGSSSTVYLKLRPDRSSAVPMRGHDNARLPQARKDGCMEFELGEYYNDQGDDGEVEMRLREVKYLNWKSGLFVEGIELRPKLVDG